MIYCLLTALGLSFVIDFIETNQNILQMVGSVALMVYAIYLLRKNPAGNLKAPKQKKGSYPQDFITGFLFTFSNPLILFLIISFFARFNFLSPDYYYYHYIIGFFFIFVGALLWWFMITYFVNKVRSHFNVRSMWLVNLIIGFVILIMSGFGFVMGIKDYITAIL
jgi:threonine/homoserine/homoserine lactone efflux protein